MLGSKVTLSTLPLRAALQNALAVRSVRHGSTIILGLAASEPSLKENVSLGFEPILSLAVCQLSLHFLSIFEVDNGFIYLLTTLVLLNYAKNYNKKTCATYF